MSISVRPKRGSVIQQLLDVVGNDIELLQRAIRASRVVVHEEVRYGFLWFRKRTRTRVVSDLEKIVAYIRAHRIPLST